MRRTDCARARIGFAQWCGDWDTRSIARARRMASFENRGGRARARRVYRLNPWIRMFSVAFLLFSLLGLFGLLWSQHEGVQGRNPAQMLEWAGITLFAVCWAIYVFAA